MQPKVISGSRKSQRDPHVDVLDKIRLHPGKATPSMGSPVFGYMMGLPNQHTQESDQTSICQCLWFEVVAHHYTIECIPTLRNDHRREATLRILASSPWQP